MTLWKLREGERRKISDEEPGGEEDRSGSLHLRSKEEKRESEEKNGGKIRNEKTCGESR